MSEQNNNGSGGLLRTILIVVVVVVAGAFAIKATLWAFKTLLWLAVVGAIGYGAYSLIRAKLPASEEETRRKALPPGTTETSDDEDPLAAFDDALRELKELKREREE